MNKNDNIRSVIEVSKYLFDRKLVSGKAGNVSARFKGSGMDIIAITPTMRSLGSIKEEDIVLIDIDGNNLTKGTPSSEINLHLAIYKANNDIGGIVHTHSPFATGFAFSDKRIKRLEGFGKITSPYLADIDYEKPGSQELADAAAHVLKNEDVLILKKHGVISTGSNVSEACSLSEFVEDIAKTQFISHTLNLSNSF
ncbi:class II aldolase/adducin family protein [Methanobrevibacter sp. TMH8]|uniref:class II aldolase/adducin family protein n=1 Tax=Methanobrevibacter sp. TMH8 TaxID=2848611 RepID=UPI001CCD5605|nr:class II aldolase/adducin family protein [Methanobrevibacter sp. TMH8]MBZ9570471.1 class II aldolase/adducin family protein [Methanobrevibacter sp. TMH8]